MTDRDHIVALLADAHIGWLAAETVVNLNIAGRAIQSGAWRRASHHLDRALAHTRSKRVEAACREALEWLGTQTQTNA